MQRTDIHLEDDQARALRALAAEQGQSVDELVRRAVVRLLAECRAGQRAYAPQSEDGRTSAAGPTPESVPDPGDEAVRALVREGLARAAQGELPAGFWLMERPDDPQGAVRAALLAERDSE